MLARDPTTFIVDVIGSKVQGEYEKAPGCSNYPGGVSACDENKEFPAEGFVIPFMVAASGHVPCKAQVIKVDSIVALMTSQGIDAIGKHIQVGHVVSKA